MLVRIRTTALYFAGLGSLVIGTVWAVQQFAFHGACDRADWASAVRWWPQNADGWRKLTGSQPEASVSSALHSAMRAVALNPQDWNNWSALAQVQIEGGNITDARKTMREMARREPGFDAPWIYAHLLYLVNDRNGFRSTAADALTFAPRDQLQQTLSEALLLTNEFDGLSQIVMQAQRETQSPRQAFELGVNYCQFLLGRRRTKDAIDWWPIVLRALPAQWDARSRVAAVGEALVSDLLAAGETVRAAAIWNDGVRAGVFARSIGSSGERIVNGNFDGPLDQSVLNWRFGCSNCGRYLSRTTASEGGRSALRIEFSGDEPENFGLLYQWLFLSPATTYDLSFKAKRLGTGTESGVFAEIFDNQSHSLLRLDAPLAQDWKSQAGQFVTPAVVASYRLEIGYSRPAGETPLKDSTLITGFSLWPAEPDSLQSTQRAQRAKS